MGRRPFRPLVSTTCNEGKSSFCTGKLAGLLEVPQGSQNVDASNLFNHNNSGTGLSALLA